MCTRRFDVGGGREEIKRIAGGRGEERQCLTLGRSDCSLCVCALGKTYVGRGRTVVGAGGGGGRCCKCAVTLEATQALLEGLDRGLACCLYYEKVLQ